MFEELKRITFPVRKWIATTACPGILQFEATSLSFSGWGEDALMRAWLTANGVDLPDIRYLDIGAAEPRRLSNTYLFYSHGARGVLVEPDPDQAAALQAIRPRDIIVNAGAAFDGRRRATLKRMRTRVFNTFREEQARTIIGASAAWLPEQHQHVVDEIEVELRPINQIVEEEMGNLAPHLLSIDTEGCDFDILRTLDLHRFQPRIICVEGGAPEFNALLSPHGYRQVAQTPDNLIFFK